MREWKSRGPDLENTWNSQESWWNHNPQTTRGPGNQVQRPNQQIGTKDKTNPRRDTKRKPRIILRIRKGKWWLKPRRRLKRKKILDIRTKVVR
jgi:hypothetical protein